MKSIIETNLIKDEVEHSPAYQRLQKVKRLVQAELQSGINTAKIELRTLLIAQGIKTSNWDELIDLLISPWIRGQEALSFVQSVNFDGDRDKLDKAKITSDDFISVINGLKNHATLPSIYFYDTKRGINFDACSQMIKLFQDYISVIEAQNFEKGQGGAISIDKIQRLRVFALFFIGGQVLNLKHSQHNSLLYRFVRIVTRISHTADSVLPNDNQISKYYKNYCKTIANSLPNVEMGGEVYGIKYNIVPYIDGIRLIIHVKPDPIERFEPIGDITNNQILLLKFISAAGFLNHELTYSIFNPATLSRLSILID